MPSTQSGLRPRDWSWRAWLTLAMFAVLLSIVCWRLWRVYQMREARTALEGIGWTIVYREVASTPTFLQQLLARVDSSGRVTSLLAPSEQYVDTVAIMEMEGGDVERDLRLLTQQPRLRSLSLQRSELDDADVALLASLTTLQHLSIASDELDDERLNALAALTRLEELTIISQRVTDDGLAVLSSLPNLQQLDVQGTRVSGTGLRHAAAPSRITRLQLGQFTSDEGLAAVGQLSHLREFTVSSRLITDQGLESLRGLQRLEFLVVADHPHVSDAGLAALAELHGLTTCAVHSQLITFAGATRLQQLPSLADLELSGGRLDDAGLADFTPPASLEVLRLYHTSVSEPALDAFAEQHPEPKLWR
jgi:hypothetical protein